MTRIIADVVVRMSLVLLLVGASLAEGPRFTASGHVELVTTKGSSRKNRSDVAVWLTPISDLEDVPAAAALPQAPKPRLVQKNKRFEPKVLVVPAGTAVDFPNRDPFFHNVFSLFEGKRFDLGLYEAGTTRSVHFDHLGVSYIFCNIHPEMSAAVIAVKTPYYTITQVDGLLQFPNVAPGRYRMQVWYEGSSPETLKKLTREITLSADEPNLGTLRVVEDSPVQAHKNKYGRDYDTRTSRPAGYGPN